MKKHKQRETNGWTDVKLIGKPYVCALLHWSICYSQSIAVFWRCATTALQVGRFFIVLSQPSYTWGPKNGSQLFFSLAAFCREKKKNHEWPQLEITWFWDFNSALLWSSVSATVTLVLCWLDERTAQKCHKFKLRFLEKLIHFFGAVVRSGGTTAKH